MATAQKVVSSRLISKFQVKDAADAPVVSGCTTLFELDGKLQVIASSVEGNFTTLYRMKSIRSTKDIDKVIIGTLPGFEKFTNIEGNWNGKSFPMRFPNKFKYDDVNCFTSSMTFGAASYVKNKADLNPSIKATPSSASTGETYPLTKLNKALGHFLMYARKLGHVSDTMSVKYGPISPNKDSVPASEAAAFAIPYVYRKYKAVLNKATKKLIVTDEAFVGAYDNSMLVPYETFKTLKFDTTTKATGVTTSTYRNVSAPYALDVFNVTIPANNVLAAVTSNMDVSTQKTETPTMAYANDYVVREIDPSLIFYHFTQKPYASQFSIGMNKKYFVQSFANFANRLHILAGHIDTKVIDSKSVPVKNNAPIVTMVGPDYLNTFYKCAESNSIATIKWRFHHRNWGAAYWPWIFQDYDTAINKYTAMSDFKFFTYAKGLKPRDLMIVPPRQKFALWDRYTEGPDKSEMARSLGVQDDWKKEPYVASSTVDSSGFVKHAPVYMYDTVLSADKKVLYILNVLADAYTFPYFQFGFGLTSPMQHNGMTDSISNAIPPNGFLKCLQDAWSGRLINNQSIMGDITVPSKFIGHEPAFAKYKEHVASGYSYWHWLMINVPYFSQDGKVLNAIANIPASSPSRKLYVDTLDVSNMLVGVRKGPYFGQSSSISTNTPRCPLSRGGLHVDGLTGVSLKHSSGMFIMGPSEDQDAITKILDFKVVYMKKRVFVAILKVAWSNKTYANAIGAIDTSEHNSQPTRITEFTMNYPDQAWIEMWEMNLALGEFGNTNIKTKAWTRDQPVSVINIGDEYPLPVIHEAKGPTITGEAWGPSLNEITQLTDFAKYKGEFLQAIYTNSGFLLTYSPHNKYGKNIQLYTAPAAGGGTYYEAKWKDVDVATNYLFVVENIK